MDNLGAHKVERIRESIEAVGAALRSAALFPRPLADRAVLDLACPRRLRSLLALLIQVCRADVLHRREW
jgi:hypothetical protein